MKKFNSTLTLLIAIYFLTYGQLNANMDRWSLSTLNHIYQNYSPESSSIGEFNALFSGRFSTERRKKKVWIDTDLAVGMKRYNREGYSDVDDGYAVLQLFNADNIHITGISAVFGNTKIDDAYRLCKKMVSDFSSYPIPVHKGAGERIDLTNVVTNDAVEAMAESLRKEPQTILAIGPATNVALLLLLYPELAPQIQEVVLVAGRRTPTSYFEIGNPVHHAPDLNFDLDNDAFRILFQKEIKVVLCPFEISNKVWLTDEDLKDLQNGSPGNEWLSNASKPWLKQWVDAGDKGFNPFDVLASHYLIAPEDLIMEPLLARLEIHVNDMQLLDKEHNFKQYLLCDKRNGYPILYCYGVVSDYHQKLMASLLK
ncbi:nucleoside hydrolase [Arenibacter sp. F20364]|uniref:nucleoside hydrolase n=1 Tax=Arenibacter sp. F20364 TaxID=2926415 RepID=UPI001FF0E128|nr:nucleoside hydrolase [Arenibacter sp. F20364]MCK0192731.1 nucleoside hydrolase [Arenibacter sp. F20364]